MIGLLIRMPWHGPNEPGLIPREQEFAIWFPEADGMFISEMNFTPRFSVESPEGNWVNSLEVPFSDVAHLYCEAKGHPRYINREDDDPATAVWRYTGILTG